MKRLSLILIILSLGLCLFSQQSDTISVVTTHDELDLTDISLVTIPTQGPYMLAGNEVHSLLEESKTTTIAFPENMYVEDLIWTGADFAIKSRNQVYMLSDVGNPVFIFEEEDFQIFPWDEQRVFVVYHNNGADIVYWGGLIQKRTKRLLSLAEEVVYVAPLGNSIMIVTRENIYLFTEEECVRYMDLWAPAKAAVMTNKGLFFATDNEICVLSGIDNFILLFDVGCRQLLFDEGLRKG